VKGHKITTVGAQAMSWLLIVAVPKEAKPLLYDDEGGSLSKDEPKQLFSDYSKQQCLGAASASVIHVCESSFLQGNRFL
jgi:hypothetical protein